MTLETSYSEARANLASLLDRVTGDAETVIIHRRGRPDVALIDAAELHSLEQTVHLLAARPNARRLFDAMDRAERGEGMAISADALRAWLKAGCPTAALPETPCP
jgi:antitoxin YefM